MRHMCRTIVFTALALITLWLVLPFPGSAQTPAAGALSLSDALNIALDANLGLAAILRHTRNAVLAAGATGTTAIVATGESRAVISYQ